MHPYCFLALLMGAILLACAATAQAGEQQIVLREHMGLKWANEFVSYPFSASRGACHKDSLTLSGPHGALPVQLSEIEYWPGGEGVRSARLSFLVAELPPLAAHTYTLRYGPQPAADGPAADLRLAPGGDSVELATSNFGIRLLLGERRYADPAAAAEVPGPVAAMRLADGTWFGGSRLYGERRIAGYRAAIEESGPVFAHVAIRYTYEDGMALDLAARLVAGDSKVSWSMSVPPPDGGGAEAADTAPKDGWRLIAEAARTAPKDGWRLLLSPGLDPLVAVLTPEYYDYKWGKQEYTNTTGWVFTPGDADLQQEPVGPITSLVPWEDWWNSFTQSQWTFKTPARGEVLKVAATDPDVWMEAAAPGTSGKWGSPSMRAKWIPLVHGEDGSIFMEISAAAGERRWEVGGAGQTRPNAERLSVQAVHTWTLPGAQVGVGRRLNQVKDYVLSWDEAAGASHPRLFASRQDLEAARARGSVDAAALSAPRKRGRGSWVGSDGDALAAYLMTDSPEVARETRVVERLSHHLGLLGNYDVMRGIGTVVSLYDGLIDSGLMSAEERQVLRARMAYLGYVMADPSTWSIERGYCSGNLNMSVMYILNLGLIACALPEHPAAKEWTRPAIAMMDRWLDENVGPAGEWPESVANYAHVSASALLVFAVAARNAGLHDFIADPRMKRLMLYLAKQYTPPDPRSGGERRPGLSLLPPSGRAGAGKTWALAGIMARATAESDPAYSRALQWSWLRAGASHFTGGGSRLSGFVHACLDPTLPAARPDWGSELFPQVGAILRHGLGTEEEWYVNLMVPAFDVDWRPSEYGAFSAIFARGVPIAGAFAGGYAEKEDLFMSRVHLARDRGTDEERRQRFYHEGDRKLADFAALPRQDYVCADLTIEKPHYLSTESGAHDQMEPVPEWPPALTPPQPPQGWGGRGGGPVRWRRQLLFVKGDRPEDAGCLLLRDTVTGGQPTMWQMWTVSEKIGTPEQAQDREQFLADKPGHQAMPARELPGDRFTAVGPFDVDTEFYIAAPTDTPRHTLRWGTTYHYAPIQGFSECMDLLHLQMPGDGAYYMALFPRRRDEPAPSFQGLAGGAIIRIRGEFGTDYAFLAAPEQAASAEGVSFRGTAGSVQDRKEGLVLALGTQGEVRCREYGLASESAASLRVQPDGLLVELPAGYAGGEVRVMVPGHWATREGTAMRSEGPWHVLAVSAGSAGVRLTRR